MRILSEKNIEPLAIDGIVISKQKAETGCFENIVFKNKTAFDTLSNVCYCIMSDEQELWKYVEVGDSSHKSVENIIVEV